MTENTLIEWAEHTWNPWMGCTKVSDGCKNCYAETFADHRMGMAEWGKDGTRVLTKGWRDPGKWHRRIMKRWRESNAVANSNPLLNMKNPVAREKVFTASLSDFFEDRPEVSARRAEAFRMMAEWQALQFLILTKRPTNISRLTAEAIGSTFWNVSIENFADHFGNVTFGVSTENQHWWDQRVPLLAAAPGRCRFISIEPLLGPIHLNSHGLLDSLRERGTVWLVVGGESGPGARECEIEWIESIIGQVDARGDDGVAVLVKQIGSNPRWRGEKFDVRLGDEKGGQIDAWPTTIRVRQPYPGNLEITEP